MPYIDGFLVPVPEAKKEAYRELAASMLPLFKDCGALRVVEAWGDDIPDGHTTDFRRAVKAETGETVVFSWIVWPSREARDAGNAKMREDPRMQQFGDMPFDGRRMVFGGFDVIMDSGE